MSYADICWEYIQKYGFITAWAIHTLTGTTCPHDVIRQLRKRHGDNIFTFKDMKKTKTIMIGGVEKKETKTYRIWYLNNERT